MKTLIKAAQVIDGTGKAIQEGAVLFEGNRILDVGPATQIGRPDEAEVIESTGTLMPGMCDAHVHLRNDGAPSEGGAHKVAEARMSYTELGLRAAKHAKMTLDAGFTMVRDCAAAGGVVIDLRNAVNAGHVEGPRIKACGMGLCITGGHMDKRLWGDQITVRDGAAPCVGEDGFRDGVRQQLRRGADFIKLNTWGSYHNSPDRFWIREMHPKEIEAACEEAHAQGVHVAAHVYGPEGVYQTVLNGVDTVEHGHWLDEKCIELMVKRGTTYVPTLTVNDEHARMAIANPALEEKYKRWHRRSSEDKWRSLEMVRAAGIRVCTGTDVGFQIQHGEWNAHELVLLVKGGFTPMEAIIASTANCADLLEIEAGRLMPGKLADLVLIDGDPLKDIAVLKNSQAMRVWKDGVAVQKAS